MGLDEQRAFDRGRQRMMEVAPRYYIQDTRSFVGNAVVWWRPEGKGYTCHLDDAGLFSEEEARRIERDRSTDKPIREDIAREAASLHVDAQRLAAVLFAHGLNKSTPSGATVL